VGRVAAGEVLDHLLYNPGPRPPSPVLEKEGFSADLIAVGLGGIVLAFAIWWLYFDHPGHIAPAPATVVVCAALMAGLATAMILAGPAPAGA
jgi:apolipoprotein N-acyltransferase